METIKTTTISTLNGMRKEIIELQETQYLP